MPQVHVSSSYFRDIFGEPDVKRGSRRISSAKMASTSGTQGEELTKGMVFVVEFMLNERDREALVDKAVDRTLETAGRFGGKNITNFLATYRNSYLHFSSKLSLY